MILPASRTLVQIEPETFLICCKTEKHELKTLQSIEREIIIKYLNHFKNNKAETADVLGVSLKSLYDRIHRHSIPTRRYRGKNYGK